MKTILTIISLFLLSCSSVKKLKTSTVKKVDSSVVANSHVQMNTKQDSTTFKISDENHEIKLEIEFDSVKDYPQNFETGKLPFTPQLHTIKIAGKEISSTQRMKLLTVMVSGETSVMDLTKNVKSDSSLADSNKSVEVKKVEVVKSRNVQRSPNILMWLGVAFIIAVGICIYIYIKRKKRKIVEKIIILVAILFALSSCKTTHIYNVTYVKDTVYVEKPVKLGWENKPNWFPIYRDTGVYKLPAMIGGYMPAMGTPFNGGWGTPNSIKLGDDHIIQKNIIGQINLDSIATIGQTTGSHHLAIGHLTLITDTVSHCTNCMYIGTDSIVTITPNWQGYEIIKPLKDSLINKGLRKRNRNCTVIGCLVDHGQILY